MTFKQETLRQLIQEKGTTFADVSREMGKHPSAVGRYVNGLSTPTIETLAEILGALGWTTEQIASTPIGEFYSIANGTN